jgi:hypothetical protein
MLALKYQSSLFLGINTKKACLKAFQHAEQRGALKTLLDLDLK